MCKLVVLTIPLESFKTCLSVKGTSNILTSEIAPMKSLEIVAFPVFLAAPINPKSIPSVSANHEFKSVVVSFVTLIFTPSTNKLTHASSAF